MESLARFDVLVCSDFIDIYSRDLIKVIQGIKQHGLGVGIWVDLMYFGFDHIK